MSVQLQLRHDTAANWAAVTPAQGEIVVDTTSNRPLLGDGSTANGWAVGLETRTAVSDAAYAIRPTDRIVAYTALTAARTVTLCAASAYPTGARLNIVDESGSCSASLAITIARAGSDVIDGQTSFVIAVAYGRIEIESNGSNAWTILSPGRSAVLSTGVTQASLSQRQVIAGLPVPTFRPTTVNTTIALDIMPNGSSPVPVYSDDLAWIDICDTDIYASASAAVNCLTLAVHSGVLEVGSKQLNGATPKPLTFTYGGTEIYRVNSTGVGIGATSFASPLTVSKNVTNPLPSYAEGTPLAHFAAADGTSPIVILDGYGAKPFWGLRYTGGTAASPTAVTSGSVLGQIAIGGYYGSGYLDYSADIVAFASQNWTSSATGSYLVFYTTPNGSMAPANVLQIGQDGSLAVAAGSKKIVDQTGVHYLGTFSVSGLPTAGTAGRMAFATNLRVFNGAGTQQGAGAGTGGLVIDNGTHWVNADAQSIVAIA